MENGFDFDYNMINTDIPINNLTSEQAAAFGGFLGLFAGGMLVFMFIVFVVVYVLMALSLYKIAIKTNTNVKHAWFAWVPILNGILMLNIAGFSGWYLLVFLVSIVPFIGALACAVFIVYVWMKISKACDKPDYLGLLMLVPLANLILPLYLAFSKSGKK
uniref:Uncharacterized protein n=1 Tax=candidate division CPR3 bacterium TaxID=2268181 RepID=A0A7C4QX97_UNCC3